jgi:hypothetical protein
MSEVRRFDLSFDAEGDCAELVERPNGDYVEYSDYAAALAKIAGLEKRIAELEQVSGHLCPKCGWAMQFPDEPCRCELETQIKSMKCCGNCAENEEGRYQPDEVTGCDTCHEFSNWQLIGATQPKFRCADRDDGCGHCPRSEPHEHPDQDCGDECYRRGGKVTCERVN